MPQPERIRDQFRGVLLGLATGDALGAPLEFQPPRPPDNYVTEMIGGGWQSLDPGEWTDDTQMTLCGVESLLEKRVFDPEDIAKRFVAWMQSDPKDIGIHTRTVLEAMQRGTPWERASREAQSLNPDSAANGSLMRCAPLALFLYRHPDYVQALAPLFSRVTHVHPDCETSCLFLNIAIVWLLLGKTKSEAAEAAWRSCTDASPAFRACIERALQPRNATSPTGYVLDTLEVALWAFLHTPNFEAALTLVVNRGADADTVGAVAGALAGAYYGASAIPERWLSVLKDREMLCNYADRLLTLADEW